MTTRAQFVADIATLQAQITTDLPDNNTSEISPEDVRDIVTGLNDLLTILSVEIKQWNDGP